MIYTLECECGWQGEVMLGMNDKKECPCPSCQGVADRRVYAADLPNIQGDTVAGGCNYNYDCGTLGQVRGKKDRAEKMKARGLMDYEPEPIYAKASGEAGYIRKNADKGDRVARAAANGIMHDAQNKMRSEKIKESMKSVTTRDLQKAARDASR